MSNALSQLPVEAPGRPSIREQLALNRHAVAAAEEISRYGQADPGWERRGFLQALRRRAPLRRVA